MKGLSFCLAVICAVVIPLTIQVMKVFAAPPSGREELIGELSLVVVFDNVPFDDKCKTDWGFSCIVSCPEKTILFDTGANGNILMSNMKVLGIDPDSIDDVVLSHAHGDHVDGLPAFLEANHDVTVCMPESFPRSLKTVVRDSGADLAEVSGPCALCKGVYVTGQMGTDIIEQALVLKTVKGLVVITGCAHPGIYRIVKKAADDHDMPVHFVCGGFHLGQTQDNDVRVIIDSFREIGVRYVGPTHCTGEAARRLFRDAYGSECIPMGAGRKLSLDDLK